MFTLFRIKARLSSQPSLSHLSLSISLSLSNPRPIRICSSSPIRYTIYISVAVPPRRLRLTKTLQRKYDRRCTIPYFSFRTLDYISMKLPSARYLVTFFFAIYRCSDVHVRANSAYVARMYVQTRDYATRQETRARQRSDEK